MNSCSVMCTICGFMQRRLTDSTSEALMGRLMVLEGLESRLPLRLRLWVQIFYASSLIWVFSWIALFCRDL